jgi:SAM-dependent methyltransferase
MTKAALIDWFRSGGDPWMGWEEVVEFMQSTHPRTIFVKSLPRHGVLLDIGAGDGSLQVLRQWLKPARLDLRFYAYAMEWAEAFSHYDRYEIGEWPNNKPVFDGERFDAILACHFIEHIPDPVEFLKWAASRLRRDGRLYIEWPSENSKDQPPRDSFRAQGIPIDTSNFYDDLTHKELPTRDSVIRAITTQNLIIDQSGFISNRLAEQEVLAHFKQGLDDKYALQFILWSRTKWAQYVIASKA